MSSNIKKDDGTGMVAPDSSGATDSNASSGAITSTGTPKKYPRQGLKTDTNKHGIRREISNAPKPPKKTGRKKV